MGDRRFVSRRVGVFVRQDQPIQSQIQKSIVRAEIVVVSRIRAAVIAEYAFD